MIERTNKTKVDEVSNKFLKSVKSVKSTGSTTTKPRNLVKTTVVVKKSTRIVKKTRT